MSVKLMRGLVRADALLRMLVAGDLVFCFSWRESERSKRVEGGGEGGRDVKGE